MFELNTWKGRQTWLFESFFCRVRAPANVEPPPPPAQPEVLAAHRVSAHTHLIGLHAYNFSTNQSDAYTFSTGQSQVYKNSTGQPQACRFSTVGFCWWPVVVTSPTDTACTQATRRVWAGNPAFKTSKTRQEKKSLSGFTWLIIYCW